MPYTDHAGHLRTWAHRRGVTRRVNHTYSGLASGATQCTVDTALPWRWLANVSNRWETTQQVECHRLGRWHWRWVFKPPGAPR